MGDAGTVRIGGEALSADIAALGAELVRLRDEADRDLLWDGDKAFWGGRSPLLFPIVGRVAGDHVRVEGVSYPMRQHGIARTALFTLADASDASCTFVLCDDAATRAAYPFAFKLSVTYRIEGALLGIEAVVDNPGDRGLPVSFGFHPAFRWPLPYGAPRAGHSIRFDTAEPDPIRVLDGGLIAPETRATPVQGRDLRLADALFQSDAVILDRVRSTGLIYRGSSGRGLGIGFEGMPQLGLWSKPGAGFVCIEPWHGMASPAGFDGELADKPGMMVLAPGGSARFGMSVAVVD